MILGDEYIELCRFVWHDCMEWEDGHYGWLAQTFSHRRNDPYAYCHNNTIIYSEFGFQHREDGPAIMRLEPKREDLWFVYGIQFTEEYEEC